MPAPGMPWYALGRHVTAAREQQSVLPVVGVPLQQVIGEMLLPERAPDWVIEAWQAQQAGDAAYLPQAAV